MRFVVSTTRFYSDGRIPCEGAVKGNISVVRNNRIVEEPVWFIDINSLEELLLLVDKCKEEVIVLRNEHDKSLYELEIYNGYRE